MAAPTEAGKGRTAADPSDPGARLLLRIGDFLEPLTRFNRSNLSMTESRHETIPVMVRQVFRVGFETKASDGNGPLPTGVKEVADAAALARDSEAQLAAARIALPRRLSAWAETHGEDMSAPRDALPTSTYHRPFTFAQAMAKLDVIPATNTPLTTAL